ncbi:MAG: hypothetical protein M1113_03075 [Candidatus Thermoplasmatota archaeon]|nr:hypothetical protein [Candidatus Thermoplasmatota archaeon]
MKYYVLVLVESVGYMDYRVHYISKKVRTEIGEGTCDMIFHKHGSRRRPRPVIPN